MNDEEQKREPDAPDTGSEGADTIEEAEGSPTDPASVPGEDPGPVEETTGEADRGAPASEAPDTAGESEGAEEMTDPETPVEDEPVVAALADELDATRRERDEYLDALRRLKAEFENARKRLDRERTRILESASENLVLGLLPVLDNLDRALEAEGDIREGVRATRDQLADVLGREGLLPVASDGQHFDPNVHEAVMGQPSDDHEEGVILQTFERGYLLNGKPIRPAKVVVARQG